MRTIKRYVAAALSLLALLSFLILPASALGEEQSYSYSYDLQDNPMPGPAPYETLYRIDTAELGVGKLKAASGLYVRGDLLYLCDTGNDRVLELRLEENTAMLVREIRQGEGWSLSGPEDVFADEAGNLFICDTGNRRILCLDGELDLRMSIEKPDSPIYDQTSEFKPEKIASTAGGRLYVQAAGVNRGLIEFSAEGEFQGYMGASSVRFDWTDYIWKIISTDAQNAQMESFVPTEYSNVAVDPDGFLFVTNSVFSTRDLQNGTAQPVRRLNLKGKNILNYELPGNINWAEEGPSRFVDVTVLDNRIIYLLDSVHCRIFAYDFMGNMLYAFGGYGNRLGWFQSPTALEHWGERLLVLDSQSGFVTVMGPTEYGALISEAVSSYDNGLYDASYEAWQGVLRLNGNYYPAYDGIGKIKLRKGEYESALKDLKYAKDEYYYSKAFQLYRKQWVEEHLIYFMAALAAVLVVGFLVKWFRRQREELENYES